MNAMITLIRREIIEHRASWAVTTVFGALFVVAALLAVVGLVRVGGIGDGMTVFEFGQGADAVEISAALTVLLMPVAAVMASVTAFVVFFYFLDALYAERKDRSILFWKSLPVSDLRTVASKYLTGVAAIPLLTILVFLVTGILIWLIGSMTLLWAGTGAAFTSGPGALAHVTGMLAYLLLVQALWFVPLHGWLLLVSAFAKRAVLGWALLPPILVVVAERTLLGTTHFAKWLGHRFSGGFELAFQGDGQGMTINIEGGQAAEVMVPALGEVLTPGPLLAAPSLWVGIALGLALLAGAVWLRRWRDES